MFSGDEVVYSAEKEKFDADASSLAFPIEWPVGMVSMEYDEESEVLVFTDAKGNAFPREGKTPWPQAKALCLECVTLNARKAVRIKAEEKARSDKEKEDNEVYAAQRMAEALAEKERVDALVHEENKAVKAAVDAVALEEKGRVNQQLDKDNQKRAKEQEEALAPELEKAKRVQGDIEARVAAEAAVTDEERAARRAEFERSMAAARAAFIDEIATKAAEKLKGNP